MPQCQTIQPHVIRHLPRTPNSKSKLRTPDCAPKLSNSVGFSSSILQVPWTADAMGRISDFSQRWLELTGLPRDETLGDGWMKAAHSDDRAARG